MTTKEIMQYSLWISMFISYISGGFTAYGYETSTIISNTHQVQIRYSAWIESEKIGKVEKWEIGEVIEWPVDQDNRIWIKVQYNNGKSGWVHEKLVSDNVHNNILSFYNNYLIKKDFVQDVIVTQNGLSPNEVPNVEDSLFLDIFNMISNQEETSSWSKKQESNFLLETKATEKISFRNMPMITTVFSEKKPETVYKTYVPRTKNSENNINISMIAKIITRFLEEKQETMYKTYVPKSNTSTSDLEGKKIIQKIVSVFDSGIKHVSFWIPRNNK